MDNYITSHWPFETVPTFPDAFWMGVLACQEGKTIEDCPFLAETKESREWVAGWQDEKNHE